MRKSQTKWTTELFIAAAQEKHGFIFNYFLFKYNDYHSKSIIICHIHGQFLQTPAKHLSGKGCPFCSGNSVNEINCLATLRPDLIKSWDFEKNIGISPSQFTVGSNKKVWWFCLNNDQHIGWQSSIKERNRGSGCLACSIKRRSDSARKTKERFVEEANLVHNNKYIYLYDYNGASFNLDIDCPDHGKFTQVASHHLNGSGCPHCGRNAKRTKEQFVKDANSIHNSKYTYPGIYINGKSYMDINCPIHGIFPQVASSHLAGHGCPKCGTGNISNSEIEWLDYFEVPEKYRQATIRYGENNKRWFFVDAFDPITNTIYEFHGDIFHGNPKVIKDFDAENPINYKTYRDLFLATMEKERILKEKGYHIINIWEDDWKKSAEKMIMDQRKKAENIAKFQNQASP